MRHEPALRRTARRFSLCDDDADDALQRALEILLTKAPTDDPRELIRWTQTVVKHEALAVRRERERILSGPAGVAAKPGREDWVALLPSGADGPPEQAERREAIARSREALQALKPQELRALSLLAEGYSYVEIEEITGFSQTKINRCLAEGRERFRKFLTRSEDGKRCKEMGALISAFCDGEASPEDAARVREHLRACVSCQAVLRAYRAAPQAAGALVPSLPLGRSLFERVHDLLGEVAARITGRGGGGDAALSQTAAGAGGASAGLAGVAKTVALCAGTAGCVAAGVLAGVVPSPLVAGPERASVPALEQRVATMQPAPDLNGGAGLAAQPKERRTRKPRSHKEVTRKEATGFAVEDPPPAPAPEAAAPETEFTPVPESEPAPAPEPSGETAAAATGSPAGEFGP